MASFRNAVRVALLGMASAASLQPVSNFGSNPGNAQMFIAVPSNLPANPAIVVCIHPCGGSATQYYNDNALGSQYADTYGYIAIYPQVTHDSNCWDVATTATETHDGGSDSESIVNMVNYAISKYSADASRVYMTGSSSGAMMTNNLAGAYPEVFQAGAAFSGIPYSCLLGSPGSSPSSADPACANGQVSMTGAQWAARVHKGYPGYTGSYPRMQIWHGTADYFVSYENFGQELLEWSAVMGLTNTKNNTNTPIPNYTQIVYGDGHDLVGYSCGGVGHYVPTRGVEMTVLSFFGLTPGGGSSPSGGSSTSSGSQPTTTSAPSKTTSPPTGGSSASHWAQCGGSGYTGPTACASPYTCSAINPYYSQCL